MYLVLVFVIFVLHAVFLPIYLYLTWHFSYWKKRGLHMALPLTLFGTYPSILTRSRNMIFDIQDVYNKYKNKHRAVGVFVTRQPQILILDPKLGHEILVKNFSQFRDTITSYWVNRKLDKYASRNPFWSAGDEWKTHRMDAQGGVTPNKLKQAFTIWENSGRKLLNYIQSLPETVDNRIETKDLAYRFCADVMCDFIWGLETGVLTKQQPNLIAETSTKWCQHAFKMHNVAYMSTIVPVLRKLFGFRFYLRKTDEFFSNLTRQAIDMRQQKPNPERADYLNHLIQLRQSKKQTHDDLVGHALTVMLDGYETTGTAMMHTIYHLANNLQVQQKLRAELNANVDANKCISYESLMSLPYLDQCVYETLRIISLVPNFSRICTNATTLELSAQKTIQIEEGMVIMVPVYSFHHDDNYFPDPDEYKPERFDNGAHLEFIKQGILLPFSEGPRVCMGNRVALMTIKTALLHILLEYEIRNANKEVQKINASSFILSLEGDVMLEYKKLV